MKGTETKQIQAKFFIDFADGWVTRTFMLLLLATAVCLLCASPVLGQTTDDWKGGAGNWSNSSNWTAGVPNGNFNVFIDNGNSAASPVTLDMNAAINNLTIDSDDSLTISDNHALTVNGSSITNNGSLTLNSGNSATELVIGSSSVTLSGTGTLTMGNNANNFIFCSAGSDVFKNQETIQGAGNIGDGSMTLTNSGTIDANAGAGQNALVIQTSGGTTNTGTLEATNGSTLVLTGASGGNVTNTGGTIKASGTGSVVALESGVTVTGGTLTTSSGGVIETPGGHTSTLNGVTNSGTYSVNDNGTTILQGTITNNSSMQLNSSNSSTEFRISGNVTLAGSGSVTMSNNANNFILGNTATSDTLTNQQTIQGAGNIGDGRMTLVNSGTIDANAGAGQNSLVIQTSGGTTNTGILEATNGSTLILTGASGGNFTNTGGTIEATGTGSVVALESGVSVTGGTLTTSSGGVIETPGGHTATLNGVTNSGTYSTNDNGTTILQGTITNNSSLQLNSSNSTTEFRISGNVILTGSGSVTMSNNGNNFILGNSTGTEVLTNQQTIQGAGNIGDGLLTLTNQGTVNANQGLGQNALIIQPGSGGVTNTGTLEATNGSTMVLNGGTFTNTNGTTNGTIQAVGASSVLALENGVTVAGGTLTDSGGGIIETPGGNTATLDGTTHTLTNSGTYSVNDNGTTVLLGTINNTGTLQLNSGNSATILKIGNATNNVSLTGGGTVTLSNNANNFIFGASGSNSLTNVNNTIQGAGNIGDGQMTLINQSVIDANAGSGQNSLVIQTSGGTTNTGTLEATNGSTLILSGVSGGNFTNTGGTIEALNSTTGTAVVALESGVNITGGTLTTTGNGVIETPGGHTSTLNGVTNSGTYSVNDNGTTILQGTITNNSSMQLNSSNSFTEFRISGNVTLAGSGSVTMSNNANNLIVGNTKTTDTLTNKETIQGSGNIGDGQMTLVNSGTTGIINANSGVGQNALTIQTSGGTTNTGTIEATNGTLILTGASGGNFTNTGGTIKATGSGSVVELVSGVTVTGGTLTDSSGGLIENLGGNTATLSGVTNSGTYSVNDNATTILAGTITNSGTMQLNSSNSFTEFKISGNTTLSGSGTLAMSNNANNLIFGNSTGTEILTSANTIQGSGNIGDAFMGFVNTGKVIANQSNTLFIDPSSAAFNNKGTVQANTGSTLDIIGAAGTFSNLNSSTNTLTGGTYIADGTIEFGTSNATANDITTNAASITLSGTSSQIIDQFGNNALANLATNATGGSFTINSGRNFTTAGNFTNNGTLTVGTSTSKFDVNGNLTNFSGTTLTGGTYNLTGTLQFNGANIVTNAANITLTGASGQIISQTSANGLANFATNASTGKFTIAGTRTFTTAGNFTNNGTLTTSNSGSKFDVNGNLTNFSGTTLTGGTYNMTGTLQFNGANIVTNAANITLTGTSSQIIDQSSNNGLANFATNASGASFTINSGRNFTTAGNFTNNGTLTVGTSTSKFDVNGNLTNFSGTTLTGGTYNITGTLQFNGANIVTNAANLTLSGTSSQIIDQSGNNGLANFATNASGGSFTINSNRNFTTAGSFTNAGTFTVASGSTFTVGGSGSLTQSGGTTTDDGTLSVGSLFNVTAGSLFGKGTITGSVDSSGTITPGDSSTKTGILTDSGTYTQNSNGTLDISIGGTTAGTKFDELNPSTASLNGTLNISLINGFVPTIGSTFKIMNYSSETGTFSTVNGLSINSSEHFTITYQGTDVLLTVVSGPAVPFLHVAPWNNRLGLPALRMGNRWLDGFAGFSTFAKSQPAHLPAVHGTILRQAAEGDTSSLIAGRSSHVILQSPPSRSTLLSNLGADGLSQALRARAPLVETTAEGPHFFHIGSQRGAFDSASKALVPANLGVSVRTMPGFSGSSQSWTVGRGVSLSNVQTFSDHILAIQRPQIQLAKPQFSPASVTSAFSGLSQNLSARAPLVKPVVGEATVFNVGSRPVAIASSATAPNSFLRYPVASLPRSLVSADGGFVPRSRLASVANFGVPTPRGGLVPYPGSFAQPTTNHGRFLAGPAPLVYGRDTNWSGVAGAKAFTAPGGGNSKASSYSSRGAAGFRAPSAMRSFSISLGNITSKPKVGFSVQ